MDLENTLPQKRGTKVRVDGTTYEIDSKGIVRDVQEAHAKKLLSGTSRTWRALIVRAPVAVEKQEAPPAPAPVAPKAAPVPAPEEVILEHPEQPEVAAPDAEKPDAGEWPEPTEEMEVAYLLQMAAAYGIKATSKQGKKRIVALIKKAMYGDEAGA